MQTLETTRALGEVDRHIIAEALKAFFDCRAAGDIEGMMELVAADIVCFPDTTWGHARYPRRIIGKDAFREAFRQRHINYVVLRSEINRVLIDGDQAVVHRSVSLRERGGGGAYAFDVVDFFRFRDGLVVEFLELPDGLARDCVVNFPH